MKEAYPVFIYDTKDRSECSFLIYIPDFDIHTQGESFVDSIKMARDAIGLNGIVLEDDKTELPIPSNEKQAVDKAKINGKLEDIDFTKGTLTYVDIDFSVYRKMMNAFTIKVQEDELDED